MRDSEFEFIRTLVYKRSRISLGPDKRELVAARVWANGCARHRLESIGDYCRLLQGPGERGGIVAADRCDLDQSYRVLPRAGAFRVRRAKDRAGNARPSPFERWPRFHAWSAACSSGEEPYSLAITLADGIGAPGLGGWTIEATDISHRVFEQARAGIYSSKAIEALPPASQRPISSGHRTAGRATTDQAGPEGQRSFPAAQPTRGPLPFPEPFQLILCRNVMIYFDRPTQEELICQLTQASFPAATCFVGHAESLSGVRHG